MMLTPMPSIAKVFSLILQQEREFGNTSLAPAASDSTAFMTATDEASKPPTFNRGGGNATRGGRSKGRNTKFCTHCRKTNHTEETCFYKYGFPPGYKTRNKGNSSNSQASASLAEADTSTSSQRASSEEPSTDQVALSKEQYQSILNLLQQSQTNSHTVNNVHNLSMKSSGNSITLPYWIMDSGATDHICPHSSAFQSLKAIKPISIKLLDHTVIKTKFSGTVVLGALTLHNVLYVPDFFVSLISIPTLVDSGNCLIVFDKPICLVMQKTPLKMIGVASKRHGLY
jgi:hypothetical protein